MDKATVTVMHPETFEQLELPITLAGDAAAFLEAGMDVQLETFQGEPAAINPPARVVCEVAEVTPLPGGSAKENRDIPAVLTNGVRVRVPKFTKAGDRIVVDTVSGEYISKE